MSIQRFLSSSFFAAGFLAGLASCGPAACGEARPGDAAAQLDPKGKIHIPIGIPDTLDALKTFVEAEGIFSPGFGSYGVYFWVFDHRTGKLAAPTMDSVKCERGLAVCGRGGCGVPCLIPGTGWKVGEVQAGTTLSHVRLSSPAGPVHVVGASVSLVNGSMTNPAAETARIALYVALRPLGPAGGPVRKLEVSEEGDALLVDGHPAIVALKRPSAAGVLETDTVGALALEGKMPSARVATSPGGSCSGALRFDLEIPPARREIPFAHGVSLDFVFPVLPGRRAVPHRWDGKSEWAQLDEAVPNPPEGGILQPDPGLQYYRELAVGDLLGAAADGWGRLLGSACLELPDSRWAECFSVAAAHLALCMNEGAPDVAVVNYNVFNRDGVYVANVLDKAGAHELAARAIDHMLEHPFSGRVYPEADNPGQILWAAAEHWLLTRDEDWLARVYPSVRKLGALIEYLHAGPGPHWVSMERLEFGEALPLQERKELKPGQCDGFHPEYTEAFDVAGLRGAARLAGVLGENLDLATWTALAERLSRAYDARFGEKLAREYGSYSVLWPCRLYPLDAGRGFEQFKGIGAKAPDGWRYFPLATAHQGLLAGNREAGHGTLEAHFAHEQCRGWYSFDEGGASGPGGWRHVLTRWNPGVAMPHGWATAELFLLLRDSIVFEDGPRLVLLAGVPPSWLRGKEGLRKEGLRVTGLPTHHGDLTLVWRRTEDGAQLLLGGSASPPGGYILRWPAGVEAKFTAGGQPVARTEEGDVLLPAGAKDVRALE